MAGASTSAGGRRRVAIAMVAGGALLGSSVRSAERPVPMYAGASVEATLYLGRLLAARGQAEGARRQIERALASPEGAERARFTNDARTLLARLDD